MILVDYWCIRGYFVIVKNLRMDMSDSGNAKNKVSHLCSVS